jgi:hypothetical protein
LILAATLAASIVATVPVAALAQDMQPPYYDRAPGEAMPDGMDRMDRQTDGWSLDRRESWLQGRIERAAERGRLSGNEEQRGRAELDAIRGEQDRLRSRDGGRLSPADHAYVERRIDELNGTLRWEGENPPPPWSNG